MLRAAWLARPRPQRTPSSITCGTPLASKSAHSASVSDLCRTSDDTDAYRMTTCSSQDAASVIFWRRWRGQVKPRRNAKLSAKPGPIMRQRGNKNEEEAARNAEIPTRQADRAARNVRRRCADALSAVPGRVRGSRRRRPAAPAHVSVVPRRSRGRRGGGPRRLPVALAHHHL